MDVGYTDAITGSKKLHMLGLDGKYAEIRFEGLSSIRGLNLLGGMIDVPGPFLHSIALSKGSGSIVTGREAISGQIVYNWKPLIAMNDFMSMSTLERMGDWKGIFSLRKR